MSCKYVRLVALELRHGGVAGLRYIFAFYHLPNCASQNAKIEYKTLVVDIPGVVSKLTCLLVGPSYSDKSIDGVPILSWDREHVPRHWNITRFTL
jgi:hypothetical protein